MDKSETQKYVQSLQMENKKLADTVDKYYKEKNELQCQVKEQQEHIECLQEELKESQTYINCLESEKNNIRLRCHETARDNFDNNMYGVLHVVTENELKKSTYDEQGHFIYENELLTTVHILSDELAKLRSQKGL